ncbi:hypothetical protein E0H45_18660 [Kribbella soli]|uniref:Type VII secretion system protein EssD-like domain-containing protein n=1 Tax=Kribbella soli TaxID=1124743 RepID=A0A4R0HAL4_9ACTN|nr:hypothetical protein E0H45_18660 [Kribbella soli]
MERRPDEARAVGRIRRRRPVPVRDRQGRAGGPRRGLARLAADRRERRPPQRDRAREAGEPDRQPTDDGGHLFATVFDGPGEAINLTAQSQEQNRAHAGSNNWRAMEQTWQAMRASGIQVHAAIDVRHANGTTDRPSSRSVVDRHNGEHSPRRIFRETKPVSSRERA